MFLAAYALVGCNSIDEKTQLTLGITSEAFVSSELDEVKIFVTANGGSAQSNVLLRRGEKELTNYAFPGTSAIIPLNEKSLEGPVLIEVLGYKSGKPVLTRRSRVSFVKDRNITIPVPLRMACFNQKCGDDQTCSGGKCVDTSPLDTRKLREFVDTEVIPLDGAACFDESVCLPNSKELNVKVTASKIESDPFGAICTFELDPAKARSTNVSIEWAAAPGRLIVLDEGDDEEGWTRLSPSAGKLAPGICAAFADKRAFSLDINKNKRTVFDQALAVAVSYTDECVTRKSSMAFCKVPDGTEERVAGAGFTWKKSGQ
jgi:hypothetical protein